MLQRQILYRNGFNNISHTNRKLGVSLKESTDVKNNFVMKLFSNPKDLEKLIDIYAHASTADEIKHLLPKLVKLSKAQQIALQGEMIREYWTNSLLSGPATQIVNLMGNMISGGLRAIETTTGAFVRGDKDLVKAMFGFNMDMQSIRDSLRLATMAFKASDGIIIGKGRSAMRDQFNNKAAITPENLQAGLTGNQHGTLYQTSFGKAFKTFGDVLRTPTRALLFGDEFFKSMNYRSYVRTEIAYRGYQKGLEGENLANFVKHEYDNLMVDNNYMFSRQNLRDKYAREADAQGLKFNEREAFIERGIKADQQARMLKGKQLEQDFRDVRNKDGEGFQTFDDQERFVLAEKAREYSLVNTFTNDPTLIGVKQIGNFLNQHPWFGFMVPFLRTPANILSFALQRTGLGAAGQVLGVATGANTKLASIRRASQESLNKITDVNNRDYAEELGKLHTGIGVTGLLAWIHWTSEGKITGYGPRDRAERQAWKDAGNQEYSIKIGDTYVSYQRLDPIATMLGIIADMNDIIADDDFGDEEKGIALNAMTGVFLVMKNNIKNKSFLQGIDTAIDTITDPESSNLAGNLIGGFAPNLLNQLLNEEDQRILRETEGLLDVFNKRIGDETLPAKRDALGEVMKMENRWLPKSIARATRLEDTGKIADIMGATSGVMNPFYGKRFKNDIVYNELYNLGGLMKPSHKIANGQINLKTLKDNQGNQAYDTYLDNMSKTKINGNTLKQAIEKLIRSDSYQAIPMDVQDEEMELMSKRKRLIIQLRNAYRAQALKETLGTSRELSEKYKQYYALRETL